MAKLMIKDSLALAGEYTFDFSADFFTGEELHLIKERTGMRVTELQEGTFDTDVLFVYGEIILRRAGLDHRSAGMIWKLSPDKLAFEGIEEDAGDGEAIPPMSEPAAEKPASGNSPSTGPSGNGVGDDSLVTRPEPTGSPV
jgi:hypothetical protein